ncbi:MAG: BatD family protein [Gammaproteobacteria bacterium]|nr:BatD family protein [Gammaproteobacteria bacterium]
MRLFLLISFLLFSHYAAAGQLVATVDRTSIASGQSLVLEVNAVGVAGELDLNGLDERFDVLSQARSNSLQIVNGSMNRSIVWRLILVPKKTGQLTIPALRVDSAQSQPIVINVRESAVDSKSSGKAEDLFIEVSLTPQSLYVQQQAVFTLRIYHAINLSEASLVMPSVEHAQFERLGEDQTYSEQRHGKTYRVIERRYGFSAQASGEMTIDPVVVQAQVPVTDAYGRQSLGSFGGLFNQTRPVRLESRSMTLKIKPRVDTMDGRWWLPARELKVEEIWPLQNKEVRVGDSITRTITLSAFGLSANQLPGIETTPSDGLQIYPDKAALNTALQGDLMLGKRVEKWALVASEPGTYTLPEVNIPWWDTVNDKARIASLPARTVVVLPALQQTESSLRPVENPTSFTPEALTNTTQESRHIWFWLAWFAFVGWALSLGAIFWWWRRQAKRDSSFPSKKEPVRLNARLRDVERACFTGEPHAVKQALLLWASKQWPDQPPMSLLQIGERLGDDAVMHEMKTLDSTHYGQSQGQANSTNPNLVRLIENALANEKKRQKAKAESLLPDL